jgi:hypothetical protein
MIDLGFAANLIEFGLERTSKSTTLSVDRCRVLEELWLGCGLDLVSYLVPALLG